MSDRKKNQKTDKALILPDPAKEKKADIFVLLLLFAFGLYMSILYWGHQVVPHFDFNCFASLGRQILSFQLPADYKRVPLVGILQVLLGKLTGADCPEFTGGLLLNAILLPFNVILIFLIAKRFIDRFGALLAVIAIINPQVVQLLTEAIVETTLLFGILLSFYLMIRRSKWVYLAAAATSMVRYEGAVLIAAAFILDMIEGPDAKARIKTFVCSALASVPLAIWAALTVINWKSLGGTYYLKEMGSQSGGKIILMDFIELTWQIVYAPLFMPSVHSGQDAFDMIFNLNMFFSAASFIIGITFAVLKKNWIILAMVLFLFVYLFIHAVHSFMVLRFCMPIVPISLIISAYGLWCLCLYLKRKTAVPDFVVIIFQAFIVLVLICWISILLADMRSIAQLSVRSVSLPYVSIAVSALICIGIVYVKGRKTLLKTITIFLFVCLMILSNQFMLTKVVGNGERDIEFKYLLDWYLENASPDEKMALTVPVILSDLAPKYEKNFIHTQEFEANSPNEFALECYKKNITYVAWDSRMGLTPQSVYYKSWKMSNIAPLAAGRDIGPYQFITQFRVDQRRYLNLYRLRPLPQTAPK